MRVSEEEEEEFPFSSMLVFTLIAKDHSEEGGFPPFSPRSHQSFAPGSIRRLSVGAYSLI